MLSFEKDGVEFHADIPTRCVYCLVELESDSKWKCGSDDSSDDSDDGNSHSFKRFKSDFPTSSAGELSVDRFQQAWRHLVPDDETIFFSTTPPICDNCGNLLKALTDTIDELESLTKTIKSISKDEIVWKKRFHDFLEELQWARIETGVRREIFSLLESVGHNRFTEHQFQTLRFTKVQEATTDLKELEIGENAVKSEEDLNDPVEAQCNTTTEENSISSADELKLTDSSEGVAPPTSASGKCQPSTSKAPAFPVELSRQTCDFCRQRIPRRDILEHIRNHVGEYALPCVNSNCTSVFSNISRYKIHLGQSSSCRQFQKKDPLSCELCSFQPVNIKDLRSHLKISHETTDQKRTMACPVSGCSERFSFRQSVLCHIATHSGIKVRNLAPPSFQTCPECDTHQPHDKMRGHLEIEHGTPPGSVIGCQHCPNLFPSREKLLDHFSIHVKTGLVVVCDLCDDPKKFSRVQGLRSHYCTDHQLELHKAPQKKPSRKNLELKYRFKCDHCDDKRIQNESSLKDHLIATHGADPYKCQFCGEEFRTWSRFRAHEKTHKGVTPKLFACDIPGCGKSYRSISWLAVHKKSVEHAGHTNAFICRHCGKGYNFKNRLNYHERNVHATERKFVCEDCGESFKTEEVLKTHRLVHTGERPFKCDICQQTFRHKEVLKRHTKGHLEKGDNFKPKGSMKNNRKRVNPK